MPAMTRKSPYAFLPMLARQGRGGTVQRVQDVIRDWLADIDWSAKVRVSVDVDPYSFL